MKKLLLIVGFLSVPLSVYAECPSEGVAEILELTPISSHYTQRVLERADSGIAYAESSSDQPLDFIVLLISWLHEVLDAMTQLVDVEVQVVEEERSLREHSPCLFVDVALIEAKMEEVRCKLSNESMDINPGGGSINAGKIARLRGLLTFLNERKHQLLLGATDPLHEDHGWQQKQLFDDPSQVWCAIMYGPEEDNNTCKQLSEEECWGAGGNAAFETEAECWATFLGTSQSQANDPSRMCPFHSNYLPPTLYGLGCDTSVLESIESLELLEPEIEGWNEITDARDELLQKVREVVDIWREIAQLLGETLPEGWGEISEMPQYEHREFHGCYETIVQTLGNDVDIENDAHQVRRNMVYILGGTRSEVRGPFSLNKDDTKLMREFALLRAGWGARREQADELKLPGEFVAEAEQEEAKARENGMSVFERAVRLLGRPYFAYFNGQQATEEASIAAKASDNQLALQDTLKQLREENQKLAELANDKSKGIRNFARKFATFLRVSCIYRPCNMQLENTLKLTLTDECFPFAQQLDVSLAQQGGDQNRLTKTPDELCKETAKLSCVLPNGDIGVQKAKDGKYWVHGDSWRLADQMTTVFECESE